jgi:hypothetical protein
MEKLTAALDQELVPLAVAARVAYQQIVREQRHPAESGYADSIRLTAMALSAVASIYRKEPRHERERALTALEVNALLFQPGMETLSLEYLYLRRGDMRRAILTLTEARRTMDRHL